MAINGKISVYCTNCSRTQGVFDGPMEALLKIAEMEHCKYCDQIFIVKKEYWYGYDWFEIPVDSSQPNSRSLQNESKMRKSNIIPFVSMSSDPADQEINNYVIGILKSLQIDYETGERYSKESIPEKVKNMIEESELFIGIIVRRDRIEGGGFTTTGWLLKELGLAQGCKKEVIAWVERGIKDIADLNYEKEIIYFDRTNLVDIQKATLKFLEALKEHKLL
jgi:hypothetical protein